MATAPNIGDNFSDDVMHIFFSRIYRKRKELTISESDKLQLSCHCCLSEASSTGKSAFEHDPQLPSFLPVRLKQQAKQEIYFYESVTLPFPSDWFTHRLEWSRFQTTATAAAAAVKKLQSIRELLRHLVAADKQLLDASPPRTYLPTFKLPIHNHDLSGAFYDAIYRSRKPLTSDWLQKSLSHMIHIHLLTVDCTG